MLLDLCFCEFLFLELFWIVFLTLTTTIKKYLLPGYCKILQIILFSSWYSLNSLFFFFTHNHRWRITSLWHPFLADEQSTALICRLALTEMNTHVMKELERAGGLDGVKENGASGGDVEGSNSNQPSKSKKKKNKKKKKKKKKNPIAENENGGLGGLGGGGGNNATTTTTTTTDNFDDFNDAKEAELLKSMGGGIMGSGIMGSGMGGMGGGTNGENDFDGEEGLGLSSEELALMKIKLLEMKKERDEQRAARKMAWERRG